MAKPNILLIVLDTARYDFVTGNDIMPGINRIADKGLEVHQCFANSPWTLPSHSSIFSGQMPSFHGVKGKGDHFSVGSDLLSLLNQHGYTTAAFSNNPWISPDFGFDSFDEYTACWKPFRRGADLAALSQAEGRLDQMREFVRVLDHDVPFTLANALYMKFLKEKGDSGASRTTKWVIDWLDDFNEKGPFFTFVNYMEPHLKYDPPEAYAEKFLPDGIEYAESMRVNQDPWAYLVGETSMTESDFEILRSLYKAELSYLDDQLDDLFTHLHRRDLFEDTAILIIGDHGENIGDHGLMDHQYSLRDSLLRVPLILHFPPEFGNSTEFDGLVELRDLFPTMLEIAGVEYPDVDDVSSKPLQWMLEFGGRDFAISEYPVPQPAVDTLRERYDHVTTDLREYDRSIRSVRTETHRYLQYGDGTEELYEVSEEGGVSEPADPLENDEFDFGNVLERELGPLSNYGGQEGGDDLSAANREHLEDLGYL